jgi:xylose isomerase
MPDGGQREVRADDLNPQPASGRQEALENLVNRYL